MGELRTFKLTIEYDGTAYCGWQRQDNGPSIQQAIEEALRSMTGEPDLFVRCAGRTDAGVHALGQVASFSSTTRIPTEGLLRGMNALVPRDIAILACEEAPEGFDARRAARGKHYRYRILNRPERSPLRDRFVWHRFAPLAVDRMDRAAEPLRGRQDFAAFRAASCDRLTTVRELRRIEIRRLEDEIVIDVEGTAFLKHMVRILVGTLVAAGSGDLDEAAVAAIRDGRRRADAGVTAPARGLSLVRVFY